MTVDRWQKVQEVFGRVSTAPPEGRAALLDDACGADAALRAEVESLLKHDGGTEDNFLSPLNVAIRRPPVEPEGWAEGLIGQQIGRYTVVRLIAAGGMGCVYEARQEHPSRSVALKVLRPGFSAPSALARFRLEPEILGRLQHPNIAQVYEAGVHTPSPSEGEGWGEGGEPAPYPLPGREGGVPYFAMELIPDAQPLDRYADAQQLSTRDRLTLFAKVCDALHHGHQKGIIHRDLKPGNILVGRDGEPKVIDFGVARASDADIVLTTQYTHAGDLIGTLRYMSPEQCDGDPNAIDTRSDVYSLGVVLYELLTGLPPYETRGTTVYAAVRVIKDEPPRRPSLVVRCVGQPGDEIRTATVRERRVQQHPPPPSLAGRGIARELRGDLDAILLKALEKDPARRYSSAADLAADIRRHLAGEPITARPPTVFTHAVRWALRHPVWATTAACGAVVTVATLVTVTAVWLMGFRPDHAEVSDSGTEVRLVTLGDHVLKTWRSAKGTFCEPELVPRPPASGGGHLLLFGSTAQVGNPYPFGLLAYHAEGDLAEPLWIRQIEPNDIPEYLATKRRDFSFGPADFRAVKILAADVFPDYPPGLANVPEIVAAYEHRSTTHTAIRIHDFAGNVLYQLWIDACIKDIAWLRHAGLLVLEGANGEAYLEERGVPTSTGQSHPVVVFAIAPKLGIRRAEYIPQEEDARAQASGPLKCAWYYCVLSPPTVGTGTAGLFVHELSNGEECVKFSISLSGLENSAHLGLHWEITAAGSWTGPFASDHYQRNQTLPDDDPARLPPPKDFKLGPLPPILYPASRPTP